MAETEQVTYVPALRMKAGELQGIQMLAPDVKAQTLPHLIIPPRKECDEEAQGFLAGIDSVPGAGLVLPKYWAGNRALLNPAFLFEDFGEVEAEKWLPRMFNLLREKRVNAIPVASVSDLLGSRARAFKKAISAGEELKLAIRILSGKFSDPAAVGEQVERAFEAMQLEPKECMVLADFTDGDMSQPESVSGVIEGVFEALENIGRWRSIVFQGTSFPEVNPADCGSSVLLPRNEWKAWESAVRFDKDASDQFVFGDYAADCAKMDFAQSGGRAIRHYRYATPTNWLIVRAAKKGTDQQLMADVCRRIVKSGHFSGRAFSAADDYIYRTAYENGGPGNSTIWRGVNTAHHITQVVRSLGSVKGLKFADLPIEKSKEQYVMFD